MTKEVVVTIDGLQSNDGEDAVTITVTGAYHNRIGKHFIQYEELKDQEGCTKNTIKISSDQIDIIKKGQTSTHMVFRLQEKTQTSYQTPYGNISLEVRTTKMQVEEERDVIKVTLLYSLSSNGSHLSNNQIFMKITSI